MQSPLTGRLSSRQGMVDASIVGSWIILHVFWRLQRPHGVVIAFAGGFGARAKSMGVYRADFAVTVRGDTCATSQKREVAPEDTVVVIVGIDCTEMPVARSDRQTSWRAPGQRGDGEPWCVLGLMTAGAPSALDAAAAVPRELLSAVLTVAAVVPEGTWESYKQGYAVGSKGRSRCSLLQLRLPVTLEATGTLPHRFEP